MIRKATILLASVILGNVASAQQHQLVFEGADVLPKIEINGEPAFVHTQGLYVTDDDYWVTGRWEKKPKRALLMRYSRNDSRTYEFTDITPPKIDGATLDHPGGFDVDTEGRFWIPLSTSNAAGPSLICRFTIEPNEPLTPCEPDRAFSVDDHIGAICVTKDGSLIGANWDTKRVYQWSTTGETLRSIARNELFAEAPDWKLAVQDWKRFQRERGALIIAGGLDKSRESSRATIQLIDIVGGKIHETHRFARQEDVSRPITNEGLDTHEQTLFLLPEDIGRGAKVLRFTIIPPK